MTEKFTKEESLNQYLECEKLLGILFEKSKFCYTECVSKLISRYPTTQPGNVGCCHNNFYISTDKGTSFLDKERERIYGHLKRNNEIINEMKKICDYHSEKGCLTTTHKSPKCVSFICSSYENYLFKKYGIIYSSNEIKKTLLEILSGKISLEEIKTFQDELINDISLIEKITTIK
ncbi:hypothetical protein KY334_05325 [Candidatus Woesearchaeota archaeon]|nr:hypothetical protein [Candidatus Woesearchaeota archaeon]